MAGASSRRLKDCPDLSTAQQRQLERRLDLMRGTAPAPAPKPQPAAKPLATAHQHGVLMLDAAIGGDEERRERACGLPQGQGRRRKILNCLRALAAFATLRVMNSLLEQARAERDRWAKVVALLEAAPSAAPRPSQKLKPKPKNSPASKDYWTPARRAEMSRRIKALNAKKKKPQQAAKKT